MDYKEKYESWLKDPALSEEGKAELSSIAGDEKALAKRLRELEAEMMGYARDLDFEKAAKVREEIKALRKSAFGASVNA